MIHVSLTGLITPSADTAPANSIAVLRLIQSRFLFVFASGLEDQFQCDLPLPCSYYAFHDCFMMNVSAFDNGRTELTLCLTLNFCVYYLLSFSLFPARLW